MRKPPRLIPWSLMASVLLSACSSAPKPPTVDESNKRPVNSRMAVELQACRNDLSNTRVLADESGRLADSTTATLAQLNARLAARPLAVAAEPTRPAPPPANRVFTVRFDFGSTQVAIPADAAIPLVEQARSAPLVLLRGRTDGPDEGRSDALAEGRVARGRAAAVRDYLVAAGVDPARIRATYQPVGDHVADNTEPAGQRLNRRVEIELYRVLPVALAASSAARP